MNIYLAVIIVILIGQYVLTAVVERLNVRAASPVLPGEFEGVYDAQSYARSQEYLKANTDLKMFEEAVHLVVILTVILAGGFNCVDMFARSFGAGAILSGLIFAGALMLLSQALNIPFSLYRTFVIEEKFGFNRMSLRTYITDMVKGLVLGIMIGGPIFALILWFFGALGGWAWIACWIGVTLFSLFLTFIAPVVIMPLFNKFVPLEPGELKAAIEDYAKDQNFKLKGIFKMDGSRRSSKSNAFFTGLGKYRRIALFDTLIQSHTAGELVSILAHEIGHFKKKHIIKNLILSFINTGLMFWILNFFLNNKGLFDAFRMEYVSVYGSLFFFGFLYTPVTIVLAVLANCLSRRHEYEADRFAVTTCGHPEDMIAALKKLTVHNLSNLTPHPVKVFMSYSHPPVLKRIEAIRAVCSCKL
ncbi:MAG: M48 family metallopeptidase [Candidatus Omnitrophota bacterium]